jgi:hypothetical protein
MMGLVLAPLYVHRVPYYELMNKGLWTAHWQLQEGETFIVLVDQEERGWLKILSPRIGIAWMPPGNSTFWVVV